MDESSYFENTLLTFTALEGYLIKKKNHRNLNIVNKNNSFIFKYFQELSEETPCIYFAYNVEANEFSYLNSAFEKVWNKTVDNAKSNPASLLKDIHPEDKGNLQNSYKQLLQGEKKKNVEFRLLVKDGEIRWLCLTTIFMMEEPANRHVIVGVVEDKTEVKEHYANLEKFAAKKNSVLEILSHDLTGPLNNIKGISSLIADEIKGYQNSELEKMVGMIANTSARSIKMIREFVQQEFLASANSSFVKKRVNIVKKVEESMEQYKSAEKVVRKKFNFSSSSKEIFLEVDDYKFLQAINNLISNAIKFTPDGDGIISVNIEDKQDHVLFTVTDNGIGIPAKYHDSLFEKFTKARRKGLMGEPSTGLGMSIIKTIVEWHGGKIWFESEENKGTTFFIQLPKE